MRTDVRFQISRCLAFSFAIVLAAIAPGSCKKADKSEGKVSAKPATGELVKVSAEGSKFDPPIKKEQVPDGAWMCDMGTVHFAASEKGNGTCELCGMPLVQKGAAPAGDDKAPAGDEAAPAGDETAPAGDEAAPAGDEAAPAGDEKAPREHTGHSH